MNTCILRGRLTDVPEIKVLANDTQTSVARFILATPNLSHKNSEGNFDTDFVKIVVYGKTADIVERFLVKGSEIIVIGRLHTYSYEKDDKKIYGYEVIANNIEFVSKCNNTNDFSCIENMSDDELPFK